MQQMHTHLTVIQVTKTTNDLLLVQLVCLELHPAHGLHHPVVLEPILPGEHSGDRGALFQPVKVTFLQCSEGGQSASGYHAADPADSDLTPLQVTTNSGKHRA